MDKILTIDNLSKSYANGNNRLKVLDNISFEIKKGETFSIVGPSGSGKTTLLGLCAGLDYADDGKIVLCGEDLTKMNENERAMLRNQKVGFVFQDFQLFPTLTALENIIIPLELLGDKNARSKGLELLEKVGLSDRGHHYPSQLSGGEQQRIALARAFANDPEILFSDEPTGNLDSDTGIRIIELLFDLNNQAGTTLVIVTHDMELAQKTDHILRIRGGKIADEISVAHG
ncbi:ABC transporter ATP-binding protein [Robertkochia solimangrovi]|uniref:ABC transporter ATP-binding protein n=1 Tax=Robertkochia solimangrovi TaxID=2213046 RepID=UPI00117D83A1|nr:ABC transporter ATP-binding protein [Robertkochia solimangrovi]TRZ46117.1 ABC transporter [Robertkochia solimangrovi]